MVKKKKTTCKVQGKGLFLKPYRGRGLLNTLINKLPLPLHVLTYSYCGPGTDLSKNTPPKNKLDSYCKEHDIFYANHPDTASRNKADMRLAEQAWNRVKANDASLGEKATAYAITNLMKAKAKLGMGLKFPNKKYGQLSAPRSRKRRAPLSRGISKKRVKREKTKSKRMRHS